MFSLKLANESILRNRDMTTRNFCTIGFRIGNIGFPQLVGNLQNKHFKVFACVQNRTYPSPTTYPY